VAVNQDQGDTGDWICSVNVMQRDRLFVRLDGVYATYEQAMEAVSQTLAGIDWPNILKVHGRQSESDERFRIIENAQLVLYCGPRKML
jgi:hypothetical protein